jgi:hypothetical protein
MKTLILFLVMMLSVSLNAQTSMVVDTGLTVIPIIENEDVPGSRYIKDIRLVYSVPPFCGNSTRAIFLLYTGEIVKPVKKFICHSRSGFISMTPEENKLLSKSQVIGIRIENLDTGVSSNHVLVDRDFFIRIYKQVDQW